MKKSRHGTLLVQIVNWKGKAKTSVVGRVAPRPQNRDLLAKPQTIAGGLFVVWRSGTDRPYHGFGGRAATKDRTRKVRPTYPSDGRSSTDESTLEGRLSRALKTRRGRLWPFSSFSSSSTELRLASSQAAGKPGERDTI
jgi:hypothetical protein